MAFFASFDHAWRAECHSVFVGYDGGGCAVWAEDKRNIKHYACAYWRLLFLRALRGIIPAS